MEEGGAVRDDREGMEQETGRRGKYTVRCCPLARAEQSTAAASQPATSQQPETAATDRTAAAAHWSKVSREKYFCCSSAKNDIQDSSPRKLHGFTTTLKMQKLL